ncbi:GNAT family N-acetyltransferase (plasmid) [Paracoccus sp. TK19116]|uniref:GNAT family N-acetyltransferase n=1 Tax=Paracoccus albicereus TaxID=2922394 RepID=A0ABT1MQ24_9RHOB|nr:GNAT family N-acetyltransferase [Paracoccus albicereus]MCQ0969046.1 GNAT family N-acetyltransferase [Paracoccus albicereus]
MTFDQMAALHARAFTRPRPWSADEIAEILGTTGAFLVSHAQGFLIGRVIADEAELLTLAVDPDARRLGIGADLTRRFLHAAASRGAAQVFLEVASDNTAARALYASLGWREAGLRRGYFARDLDALVLRIDLESHEKDG